MTNLTLPIFNNPEAARAHLEAIRWPDGNPNCPHCGVLGEATLVQGKSHRPGMYQCNACRKPFSVTVGTVMESSKIPLNKWVLGFHLMASSKKGISAHQLHRMLGVTYKTAWFMSHRIREAMAPVPGAAPMGGAGNVVEADETYISKQEDRAVSPRRGKRPYTKSGKSGVGGKRTVVSLVERGGAVRSFHVQRADAETVAAIVNANIHPETAMYSDESRLYTKVGKTLAEHSTVNHASKEYARGCVHTNTVEGYFSIFKRGMEGVYQHCGEQHLHRYLAEFDFRYSHRSGLGYEDTGRAAIAIKGAVGKRLTYRTISG